MYLCSEPIMLNVMEDPACQCPCSFALLHISIQAGCPHLVTAVCCLRAEVALAAQKCVMIGSQRTAESAVDALYQLQWGYELWFPPEFMNRTHNSHQQHSKSLLL